MLEFRAASVFPAHIICRASAASTSAHVHTLAGHSFAQRGGGERGGDRK